MYKYLIEIINDAFKASYKMFAFGSGKLKKHLFTHMQVLLDT